MERISGWEGERGGEDEGTEGWREELTMNKGLDTERKTGTEEGGVGKSVSQDRRVT